MYEDYIEMRKQALEYGRLANYLIAEFADRGKDHATQEAARLAASVSIPAEDRSDPRQDRAYTGSLGCCSARSTLPTSLDFGGLSMAALALIWVYLAVITRKGPFRHLSITLKS